MRDWTENQINFVLIRHGATPSNKQHRYLGRTDESLSAEGMEALKNKKQKGYYPDIDVLFSSPMKRCLESGEILYPGKCPVVISEFKEMEFGDFEGKNYIDLQGDMRYQAWIDSNGILPFPNGESREQFVRRCEQGYLKMLTYLLNELPEMNRYNTKRKITIGVIAHGGTIMALLSQFCGGEYFDYQVANGNGYLCTLNYCGERL